MKRKPSKRPPPPKGPYVAVCGKCNLDIELHPITHCPLTYKPVSFNGRRYGWMVAEKAP